VAEERGGFLSRWARRKAAALGETRPEEPASSATPLVLEVEALRPANPAEGSPLVAQPALVPAQPEPALSLDDVKFLTKDSDFKPFMAKGVGPEVRNAALKKLFADPHFNVMDGLDTYIDDYSKSDPIPEAMLRQMSSAKVLGLFDEEKSDPEGGEIQYAAPTREDANNPGPQSMAELGETTGTMEPPTAYSSDPSSADLLLDATGSTYPIASQEDHANTDLRLQPDHAATTQDTGRGT
jgi:Protein of unknown function (DUF3306)